MPMSVSNHATFAQRHPDEAEVSTEHIRYSYHTKLPLLEAPSVSLLRSETLPADIQWRSHEKLLDATSRTEK